MLDRGGGASLVMWSALAARAPWYVAGPAIALLINDVRAP